MIPDSLRVINPSLLLDKHKQNQEKKKNGSLPMHDIFSVINLQIRWGKKKKKKKGGEGNKYLEAQ